MKDAWLEELSYRESLDLLRAHRVGRVAITLDEMPVILPVTYRLVETSGRAWLALRTRPGNVLDQPGARVAFEVDDIDPGRHEGASVLVGGTLHHVDPEAADFAARFDPEPWIVDERDAWLVIEPYSVTGRRLHAAEQAWAFHPESYL